MSDKPLSDEEIEDALRVYEALVSFPDDERGLLGMAIHALRDLQRCRAALRSLTTQTIAPVVRKPVIVHGGEDHWPGAPCKICEALGEES